MYLHSNLLKLLFSSYLQGNNYFKQGNFDEAIKCYTKGMHYDPYNPVLPTNRASAFYRMKK